MQQIAESVRIPGYTSHPTSMSLLLPRTLLVAALLVHLGCDSSSPDPARSQTDADLQLELGETASSDGLTITFKAVIGDSRCPEGVECIWAGEAHVRLVVDGTAEEILASDPVLAPEAVIRRGNVTLRAINLTPYPGSRADTRGDTPVVFLVTEISSE